ncbi:unnamed protein product [Microthlaspi erraticum]|uniref:Uncharacterized protein n=1 Tax=Microthlaspi erraticum TaxID=1685480 RepID=A0A6D2IKB0_9BRAS|nr:unnamed protein product [Microthlaspi erraticum]
MFSPSHDGAASPPTSPPPSIVPAGFEEPTPQAINHSMALLLGVPPVDNQTLAAFVAANAAAVTPPTRRVFYPPPLVMYAPPAMLAPPSQYSFANRHRHLITLHRCHIPPVTRGEDMPIPSHILLYKARWLRHVGFL